jgi:thymidylate synthase ThyX
MEIVFPRIALADFNTHRVFSRNSSSSRAIPVEKLLEKVRTNPFVPDYLGANQPGMSADNELTGDARQAAIDEWLKARDDAVAHAEKLVEIGLHKQLTNRLIEAFTWHTVIVTASEWENFFALRANPDAQPELRRVAELMKDAYRTSIPTPLEDGQWHLPLLQDDEQDWATENIEDAIKVCCGRSARVSYLTHDGKRDHAKDIELYDRLTEGGHMSPLEHVARPMTSEELEAGEWSGNFRGWHQHRKDVIHEDNFAEVGKN